MSVEPAAGSNPGPDCQRPAGRGSHTREISVAISDIHIITHTAQLLTLWHGWGPCAKHQPSAGRFRFCDGWCGLWASSINVCFVVALVEEVRHATVRTAVDATLHHADSHPVRGLKYVHFRNVAVCL